VPTVTNRLRLLRTGRGWTQRELSERSGVSVTTISNWEQQDVKAYDVEVLAKLAAALGVEIGLMLTTIPEPE
jgi:transcriptional regulator with XRE-family HTH domain